MSFGANSLCLRDRGLHIEKLSSTSSKGPVIWSRVPETTLPPMQLYRVFVCENVVFCRPSQTEHDYS